MKKTYNKPICHIMNLSMTSMLLQSSIKTSGQTTSGGGIKSGDAKGYDENWDPDVDY